MNETGQIERRKAPRLEERALVMAIATVFERITRLSDEDKADLFELVKEVQKVKTQEELDAIQTAMLEILEQAPVTATGLDLETPRPSKLQKWVDYVGKKIREKRNAADMTQEQLAQKSGLPQSHISRLEQGQHSPSRVTLEKIAKALGTPIGDPSAE